MPRIEVMNIKFNLDSNDRDAEVYAALCDIPRGKRSSVVKELLHAALCQDEAASRPLPQLFSPSPIRKTHSERTGEGTSAAAAVETVQTKENTQELDEFKSLIY
jgi:hypothetical protein